MASKLHLVSTAADVVQSLLHFNRDASRFPDLAWDLARRTRYWVLDEHTGMFGPNKFVGFTGMTYDLYQDARDNRVGGAKFDGTVARRAIRRAVGSYTSDPQLHADLQVWATRLVGPHIFDGLDTAKWAFLRVGGPVPGFDWSGWDPWQPLTDSTVGALPSRPGAYVVRVLSEDGTTPQPMRRCCGDDPLGILDIGESKDVRKRLTNLLTCMHDENRSGHMAGWRYAFLGMHKLFPTRRLEVRVKGAPSKKAAHGLEGDMLAVYVRRHFELPPLNYKMNWSAM